MADGEEEEGQRDLGQRRQDRLAPRVQEAVMTSASAATT